jgi:hypothetical protein
MITQETAQLLVSLPILAIGICTFLKGLRGMENADRIDFSFGIVIIGVLFTFLGAMATIGSLADLCETLPSGKPEQTITVRIDQE